ncbi:MAG TPA: DUF4920 domain-containing protein [Pyrinomonadaceae bacterium]|nr:DUF4920 domain-containing protein [Pyrinomonadaceae bacterium]
MKKTILLSVIVLTLSALAFAQGEMNSKGEPVVKSKDNAPVELKEGDKILRGVALATNVKKTSVEKAFAEPDKVAGKTVELKGVIVRSCKKEGCWAEIADKEGGKSVRVTFGDHAFFIPLNAAGLNVRAQGTFKTNVLPKEHVDHLIKDDGAKFDKINPDGTVTEVSFDATGVELVKGK